MPPPPVSRCYACTPCPACQRQDEVRRQYEEVVKQSVEAVQHSRELRDYICTLREARNVPIRLDGPPPMKEDAL